MPPNAHECYTNAKRKRAAMPDNKYRKNRRSIVWQGIIWVEGIVLVWLVALLLRQIGTVATLDNSITALGFDKNRALFLDALILTLLSSLIAGLLLRHRASIWLGGMIFFCIHYLRPFIQQAQNPGLGPDGQSQILLPMVFSTELLTMTALSLLLAGMGAVLGTAWGNTLITPLFIPLKRAIHFHNPQPCSKQTSTTQLSLPGIVSSFIFGLLLLCALLISLNGSGPLLMYGPLVNLYKSANNTSSLPHGTVLQGTFTSPTLGSVARTYWIYLPATYTTTTSQRYPTLYMLHGSPGSPADWFVAGHAATTADILIAEHKMRATIIISPDGNGPIYHFSEWANSFDGRQRMEDAIALDLVAFIDNHYRTITSAKERAIAGLSMGGYGAVNIALHHPNVFHKVISLGGYFQATGPVFGSGTNALAYQQLNSPAIFIRTVQGKQALLNDFIIIGAGTSDKSFYHKDISFYQDLLSLKASTQLISNTGDHSWSLWSLQLREALPLLQF